MTRINRPTPAAHGLINPIKISDNIEKNETTSCTKDSGSATLMPTETSSKNKIIFLNYSERLLVNKISKICPSNYYCMKVLH